MLIEPGLIVGRIASPFHWFKTKSQRNQRQLNAPIPIYCVRARKSILPKLRKRQLVAAAQVRIGG